MYSGLRGSYCWPTSAFGALCADTFGWADFGGTPPIVVRAEEPYSLVFSADTQPQTTTISLHTMVETVVGTSTSVRVNRSVPPITPRPEQMFNVPEGTYYVSVFARWPEGDVVFAFNVRVAE